MDELASSSDDEGDEEGDTGVPMNHAGTAHGSGAVEHYGVGMLGLEENNKRPLENVAGLLKLPNAEASE